MSKKKHTPGPWAIEDPMEGSLWIVRAGLPAHEWNTIAIIPTDDDEIGELGGIKKPEAIANANLIRKAPEMQAEIDRLTAREKVLTEALDDRLRKDRPFEILNRLRADGWSVAVHNDYRLNGTSYTFYLLTHPSGVWVKGEATTDADALMEIVEKARTALEGDA